jgi:tetratricopeptide (TPR) repeat protein
LATEGDKENSSIFANEEPVKKDLTKSPLVIKLENQKVAENERIKGNEAVKAKEYKEAVTAYTRSIELNPDEAFTYANRAMAFLKLKNYGNVIMDANKAIKIKPGYLKAFHRRGKAYAALNKHEDAIKDFQYILEEEPENKDVNKDLMTSRQKLTEIESKKGATIEEVVEDEAPKPKKEFVRVAIEESSDEEEEESSNGIINSKFPLKSLKEIEDHAKMAKKLMQ